MAKNRVATIENLITLVTAAVALADSDFELALSLAGMARECRDEMPDNEYEFTDKIDDKPVVSAVFDKFNEKFSW